MTFIPISFNRGKVEWGLEPLGDSEAIVLYVHDKSSTAKVPITTLSIKQAELFLKAVFDTLRIEPTG